MQNCSLLLFVDEWEGDISIFACICIKYVWKDMQVTNNKGCLSGRELGGTGMGHTADFTLGTLSCVLFCATGGSYA